MIFKEHEIRFNIHPTSDLETYCKLENVSMLFICKPDRPKSNMRRLEKARVVVGNKIIKLGLHIAGVQNTGLAN